MTGPKPTLLFYRGDYYCYVDFVEKNDWKGASITVAFITSGVPIPPESWVVQYLPFDSRYDYGLCVGDVVHRKVLAKHASNEIYCYLTGGKENAV